MKQNPNDRSPSLDSLVSGLEGQGYRFSRFEFYLLDPCDPVDVEWNYKDIAHAPFVHSHMWREFVYIGNRCYTTVDIQKLFGLSVPQSTAFYVTDDNRLIAHTTLFFFIILVEARFEQAGEVQTGTTTRYAIGARSWLTHLLSPLLRFGIHRNWKRFMKEDRPVRQRRGELRRMGFSFDDASPIDMRKTLQINETGVFPPDADPEETDFEFDVSENRARTIRIGESDHFGLQIKVSPQSIEIFPRLCPHQGCSLDDGEFDGRAITCSWHGRKFGALCVIENNGRKQEFEGPLHRCFYEGEKLAITLKRPSEEGLHLSDRESGIDWTKAWQAPAR